MFAYRNRTVFSRIPEIVKIIIVFALFIGAFLTDSNIILLHMFLIVLILLLIVDLSIIKKIITVFVPLMLVSSGMLYLFFFKTIDKSFILRAELRILVVFMAFAFLSSTTDLFSILRFLRKLHLPRTIYLSFYIILRFLPELEAEYNEVNEIQKSRGITIKKYGLFKYLKSYFLPVIYTMLQRADELSIAVYLREKKGKEI